MISSRIILASTLLLLSVFVSAQENAADSTQSKPQKNEWKQTKDEFISGVKARLKKLDVKIDKVKEDAVELKQDKSEDFRKIMESIKTKKEKLNEKMSQLKDDTGEKTDAAKKEINEAMGKLQEEYDRLVSKLKKDEMKEPQKNHLE